MLVILEWQRLGMQAKKVTAKTGMARPCEEGEMGTARFGELEPGHCVSEDADAAC